MDLGNIATMIITYIGGSLTTFMFFPQMRKTKNIENESKQSEEWRKLYEETKMEAREKDSKIDSLYAEITKHRDAKATLADKVSQLQVENTSLKYLKCGKPGCQNRTPPTGY